MQETIEFYKNIINLLPGHIFWKDSNGTYLGCNEEHLRSLGLSSVEEIIGKTDYDLIWKDNAAKLKEADNRVISERKVLIFEETVKLASGEIATFLSKKVPLKDINGKIIGILGTSVDITKHKDLEIQLIKEIAEKEAAEKAKAEFMREASHEIRSDLSNVVYTINFQENDIDALEKSLYDIYDFLVQSEKSAILKGMLTTIDAMKQKQKKSIYAAQRGIERLSDLVYLHNQLTEKECKPNFERITIRKYIEDIVEENHIYKNANIKIHLDINTKTVPKSARLDYMNIQYCLKVVIDNALRFSKDNDVIKIDVNYIKNDASPNKGLLIISVSDMGEGISEKQMSYLFEVKNYMNVAANNHQILKPSLRLPLVKKNIECSGGKIKVESKFGYGTTVTLEIPVSEPEFETQSNSSYIDMKKLNKPTVLLVEDEPALRESIQAMLETANYSVDSVSNGAQALAKIADGKRYEIMLLDIVLPDTNGVSLMNDIKSRIDYKVPFIAQTSRASEEEATNLEKVGFMTVLAKPFTLEQLKTTLEDAMQAINDEESD